MSDFEHEHELEAAEEHDHEEHEHHDHEHCEHEHHHHDHEHCEHEHHHHDHEHSNHDHEHHHHDHEHCDHDHEHHHDHDCCDHDHEHHHDHDCCDHDHEHEHHHGFELEITTHDSSIIATYKFNLSKPKEEAIALTDQFFLDLGAHIREEHGFIGHIKATVLLASEGYKISLTKDTIDKSEFDNNTMVVEGVAIVFNLTEEQLEEITEHEIEELLEK